MLSATINPIVHNSFAAEADPKKDNDQNAYWRSKMNEKKTIVRIIVFLNMK